MEYELSAGSNKKSSSMSNKKSSSGSNMVFNEEDYDSGDGMMTSVWGPPLWHTLHTISFNYPVKPTIKQAKQYMDWFKNLGYILPCKYCRDNLVKNLKKLPLEPKVFKNRNSLSRYVYELHEIVNTMLGKKSGLTYEDVRDRYEHFRARCIEEPNKNIKPKIEKGCTEPLYGVKSKCVLNIIPKDEICESMKIDPKCVLKRKN